MKSLPFSWTVMLAAMAASLPLSMDMYLPSMPRLADDFGASPGEVQRTLVMFTLGFGLAHLVVGPISDRYGRKPALMLGFFGFSIASIACAFTPKLEALLAMRMVQGFFAAFGPILMRAIVRDQLERTQAAAAFAKIGVVMGLAPALAPIFGEQLASLHGWHAIFVFLSLYGVVCAALAATSLKETNTALDSGALRFGEVLSAAGFLLRNRVFVVYALCAAFAFGGLFAFISGSSFVLISGFGVPPADYALMFALVVGGFIAGNGAGLLLGKRLSLDNKLLLATFTCAVAGVLMIVLSKAAPNMWQVVIGPMCLYNIGWGLLQPQAQAGAMSAVQDMAGRASTVLGLIQLLLASFIGYLLSVFATGSAIGLAATIGACAATIFALAISIRFLRSGHGLDRA